jgi:hypothetical protein
MDPALLAAGRAAAARNFTDTCTVERRGATQTDPLDGRVTVEMDTIYSGPCRFQQAAAPWAGPAEVGQAQLRISAMELQLPVVGSEGIAVDDVVTCVTSVHDADLVGRSFSVAGEHHASHKTTRRLPLQEILS